MLRLGLPKYRPEARPVPMAAEPDPFRELPRSEPIAVLILAENFRARRPISYCWWIEVGGGIMLTF